MSLVPTLACPSQPMSRAWPAPLALLDRVSLALSHKTLPSPLPPPPLLPSASLPHFPSLPFLHPGTATPLPAAFAFRFTFNTDILDISCCDSFHAPYQALWWKVGRLLTFHRVKPTRRTFTFVDYYCFLIVVVCRLLFPSMLLVLLFRLRSVIFLDGKSCLTSLFHCRGQGRE